MIWQHALVIFIVVGVPILNVYGLRRLKKRAHTSNKITTYVQTIVMLWLMVGIIWYVSPTVSLLNTEQVLSFNWVIISSFALASLYLVIVTVVPLFLLRLPAYKAQMQAVFQERNFIMPLTRLEQMMFILVAISVGICEEIIFRSFLSHYFVSGLFMWSMLPSLIVSALIFGIGHFHQGMNGIINATVFAYVMSVVFLLTGSLLLPILIHILYDLRVLILARGNQSSIREN